MGSVETTRTIEPSRPNGSAARRMPHPVRDGGLFTGRLGRAAGLVSAGLVLAGACALSLAVGSYLVPVVDMLSAVVSPGNGDVGRVVWHVRVPRTITGLLAGMALGVAGAVMQGLTRNPLAGPGAWRAGRTLPGWPTARTWLSAVGG